MIAAPKPGDHVKIQSVYETPTHIRRVVGTEAAAGVDAAGAVRPASLQNSASLAGCPVRGHVPRGRREVQRVAEAAGRRREGRIGLQPEGREPG
nr:hypothetical protein GCM10020092_008580 [Actinoplanes digitatis]